MKRCYRKLGSHQSALILMLFLMVSATASAQFLCSSELEYSWVKVSDTGELAKDEMKVFWVSKEFKADSEDLARKMLAEKMQAEKSLARQACKKEHENLSGCIASKFQAMKAVMKQLDFSSRKTLEESVATDCKAQLGVCKMVHMKEVTCKDIAPKDEEGEADGKKKKKK